jgi:hypothetical protein
MGSSTERSNDTDKYTKVYGRGVAEDMQADKTVKFFRPLLQYKQQQKALGNHVKTLIKEKENVLINLELMNMNNASLLNYEEFRRRTIEVEKKKLVEENKEYKRNLQQLQA